MNSESAIDVVWQQVLGVRIYLSRPVVQTQLITVIAAVILAWLLSIALRAVQMRLLARYLPEKFRAVWAKRLHALTRFYLPVLGAILLQLAVWLFDRLGRPSGLLSSGIRLMLLLVLFRLGEVAIYHWFSPARARIYYWRILVPLMSVILIVLGSNVFNLEGLMALRLIELSGTVVTLGRLAGAIVVFYIFIVLSMLLQDFLLSSAMARSEVDPSVINSILSISRYFVIMLGLLVALGTLGFSLSTLAVIGGGLSIGVGFGLQQIIGNFIAGILLIFEQALRPGDVIELDGEIGTVQKLSIRSTLLRTNDNVELIIPNQNFLTSAVKTYTKSNRQVRIPIGVGVGYDSDPDEIREILMNVARRHPMVRPEPEPVVFFLGFGASSLDFQLNAWVDEPIMKAQISSAIYFEIWQAFKERNIEIPFPQQDLNLRRGWEKLVPPDDK